MKARIIVNPVAGRGKGKALLPLVETRLTELDICYDIQISDHPDGVTQLVRDSEVDLIVAIGGDGTFSEVARGMRSDQVLCMIPSGTGNDYLRNFESVDPQSIIACIESTLPCHLVDYGILSNRPFLNSLTMGIDGQIIKRTQRLKRHLNGKIAYFLSTLIEVLRLRSYGIRLTIDGQVVEEEMLLVAIANGPYIGGGMAIAPSADLTDGRLHVVIIRAMTLARLLTRLPYLFNGRILDLPEVSSYAGESIMIEHTGEPFPISADGTFVQESPGVARIVKRQLRVLNRTNMKWREESND